MGQSAEGTKGTGVTEQPADKNGAKTTCGCGCNSGTKEK